MKKYMCIVMAVMVVMMNGVLLAVAGDAEDWAITQSLGLQNKHAECVAAAEKYLVNYTAGTHRAEAEWTAVYGLFAQDKWSEVVPVAERYLSDYPAGKERHEVMNILFFALKMQDKLEECAVASEKYLVDLPIGQFRSDAQRNIIAALVKQGKLVDAANKVLTADLPYDEQFRELNTIAQRLDKIMLRKEGKSIIGPSALARTIALITAENTGVGFSEALTALGLAIPSDWGTKTAAVLAEKKMVLDGMVEPTTDFLNRVVRYLGVDGMKEFVKAYNGE